MGMTYSLHQPTSRTAAPHAEAVTSTVIAIAGIPGCGKTTLATGLAKALGARLSLERFDAVTNPFLERFYASHEGMRRYAFHSQLTFLTQKVSELRAQRRAGGLVVQDQALGADINVFAAGHAERGIMAPEEWELFTRIAAEMLESDAGRPPELVIALTGPLQTVIDRILERGRPSEINVEPEYWAGLHARFHRWLQRYAEGPIITLDIRDYDVVNDPAALPAIIAQVRSTVVRSATT